MNIKWLWTILSAIFLLVIFFPNNINAQQGCCSYHNGISYCDTSAGRYVCNDGTYSPTCTCGYSPTYYYQSTPKAPDITASFTYTPNSNGTFEVIMDWSDVTNTGFSIALQKSAGGNPGPNVDTYTSNWTFNNVYPGTYFANMKVGINNVWSSVVYWNVTVPNWYPPSTPTPTSEAVVSVPNSSETDSIDPTSSLITVSIVVVAIFGFLGFVFWISVKVIIKVIHYIKDNTWIIQVVFWGGVIVIAIIYFLSQNKPAADINSADRKYTCNCSRTCSNMTCAEAYFQLNDCGCSQRDADRDGVPCEAQCR